MRVAEITCRSRSCRLPDLGLDLVKGQKVEISEQQAKGSQDLALMRRINAVRLRWAHRADLNMDPNPAPNRVPSPAQVSRAPHYQPVPEPVGIDIEAFADKLIARLTPVVARLIQAMPHSGSSPRITESAPGTVPIQTPAYIPEKILDESMRADIRTQKTESDGSGVSAAKAALKKARGSGRK